MKTIKGPITWTSLVLIILIVGAGTAYNIYINPVEESEELTDVWDEWYSYFEDNVWENITKYDIDLWYPSGCIVEELRLDGQPNSYEKGGLLVTNNPAFPEGRFFLIWKPLKGFISWASERDYVIEVSQEDFAFDPEQIDQPPSPFLSYQDHYHVLTHLNGTGRDSTKMIGFMIGQSCEETDRIILSLYYNAETHDAYSLVRSGSVNTLTYRCHPYEGTPIDPFIRP